MKIFKQLNEFAPHIILTPDDMKRLQIQSSNLTKWRPFLNEILDILFTKEELARSCAMGSMDRKTGNQRPPLNPTLIADLKNYAKMKWPYIPPATKGEKANGCRDEDINRVINLKCGSARKPPASEKPARRRPKKELIEIQTTNNEESQ
ncbi:uncharacterized protein [Clytia hemisphaerica]|uniref:uncharacterized protein n=1 Tax=Clytia hemisphaerica TaxID=252671 RepID=UPI0034D567DE